MRIRFIGTVVVVLALLIGCGGDDRPASPESTDDFGGAALAVIPPVTEAGERVQVVVAAREPSRAFIGSGGELEEEIGKGVWKPIYAFSGDGSTHPIGEGKGLSSGVGLSVPSDEFIVLPMLPPGGYRVTKEVASRGAEEELLLTASIEITAPRDK